MAFTNRAYPKQLSDLVVSEVNPSLGYARETINVTAGATVPFGQVVFRTKSADPLAPYALITAAGNVALANEYAVVFGDNYGVQDSFVANALETNATTGNAVAFTRGPVILKEHYIKEIATLSTGANLTAAKFGELKELLAKQGVIIEDSLTAE